MKDTRERYGVDSPDPNDKVAAGCYMWIAAILFAVAVFFERPQIENTRVFS